MRVKDLVRILKTHDQSAILRFSVANDLSPNTEERWFAEDGVHDVFGDASEVTICLVVHSNMDDSNAVR